MILYSRRPPRKKFGLPVEMLWWIPQVKSCPCARKAKPIHASNPMLAPFSIIFPLFLPFHSQSFMTSVLWCPPTTLSAIVWRGISTLPGREIRFGVENKSHVDIDGQLCVYGSNTCLIWSRGMRAHNSSFILSSKLGKWFFFNVVVVKNLSLCCL